MRQRGTGSIRSKHGGWEVRINVGRDGRGRYKQLSRFVRGSKRDAEQTLLRLRLEHGDQAALDATKATVADLITAWLSMARRNLSPSTVAGYESYITNHIVPRIGHILVRRLNAAQLDRLYADLLDIPLSPRSVRQCHAIIGRALHQAERWNWVHRSVAELASPPRVDRADVQPPAPADVGAFLDELRTVDVDLADFLHLAAVTGARRGELCGLQWDDIDLDDGVLRIARAVALDGARKLHVKDTKTHASRRVALDASTIAMLRARRARRREQCFAEGDPMGPWVWPSDRDEDSPMDPALVTGRYRRAAARAGLKARLHDFRHMAATQLLDAGVAPNVITDRLGWRSTTMLLNVYGHAVAERDRQAADLLGAALRRPG